LIAASVDSAPELAKNTLSRCGTSGEQPFGQNAGERRDVHLHQVRQVGIEHALSAARIAGWLRPTAKTPTRSTGRIATIFAM